MAGRCSRTTLISTPRCASFAITDRPSATCTATVSTAVWTISMPACSARQAQAHPRVERPAHPVGPARCTAGLEGASHIDLPHVRSGLPPRVSPLCHRDELPGAPGPIAGDFLCAERDRCQDALLDRHSQAGGISPGIKGARIVGPVANAERNAASCVSLPMYPELTAAEVDYVVAKVLEWDKAAK